MMDLLHSIVLAIIQGLTEFLPVSSSAHLILAPKLLDWQDPGLVFDVTLHIGTLFAVLAYFRTEIKSLSIAWYKSIANGIHTDNSKLAWSIGLATIPAGLAGMFLQKAADTYLRTTVIIAATSIAFGLLLGLASLISSKKKTEYNLTWKDVAVIGFAQCLALIPGVSRSGMTMTAGLFVGLTKEACARYSFLLSIPIIMSAGVFGTVKLLQSETIVPWDMVLTGLFCSFITGYLCIKVFLQMLNKIGFMPFVIYRVLLGLALLIFI